LNPLDDVIGRAHFPQDLARDRMPIKKDGQEDMLTADVLMPESAALLACSQ